MIRKTGIFAVALVALAVVIAACSNISQDKDNMDNRIINRFVNDIEATVAVNKCMEICRAELNKSRDLSNGPCLSENITKNYVCDVAHEPRMAVDNKKENQCKEFGKTRMHFVEVDEKCNFIRIY